jgi:hypothetical protein
MTGKGGYDKKKQIANTIQPQLRRHFLMSQ